MSGIGSTLPTYQAYIIYVKHARRAPSHQRKQQNLSCHWKRSKKLSQYNYADPIPDILLCGDFNLPHATWPDGLAGPGSSADERIMLRALMDIAGEFFLQQVIEKPPHKHGNMLDLLFTNNLHFLHGHDTVETIFWDHRIVECATTYQVDNPLGNTEHFSFSSEPGPSFHNLNFFSDDVDWEGLEDELSSHDWKSEFQQLGLDNIF